MKGQDREISLICEIQNQLNTIGFNSKLNLPTIIVIGCQSSGKSSVLEHIAGKDFLPKGQGIVTRRPVIIQKIVDPSISQDFALIPENPNQRIFDFEYLRQHLQQKMQEAALSSQGVTQEPSVVKLIVKEGVNISMIDMPGLTKIALKDQAHNFPQLLEEISRTYIQNPNSIILAISPANVDFANSDSLKLAKEYDPQGERTIGVFTKMDLIEDPNTIRKAFEGKAYPLKLGYYGVVCRNQMDINKRISIQQALQNEQQFFARNTLFNDFRQNCGIMNLQYKLNQTLLGKIKETLPIIKTTLQMNIRQKEEHFSNFKKINDLYKQQAYSALLLNLVNTFVSNLGSALRGGSQNLKVKDKLYGGAKITVIFESDFYKKLFSVNIFDKIKDDEIYWTIKNSTGLQQTVFFSNEAFENLAKKQVMELKPASLECLYNVNDEIKNIAKDILNDMKELSMFEKISREIFSSMEEFMVKFFNDAKQAIELYFKVQAGCINQKHPQFVKQRNEILEGNVQLEQEPLKHGGFFDFFTGKKDIKMGNQKDVMTMKNLLTSYNQTIKNDVYDYVQKAIVSLFINEMLVCADQELLNSVLKKGGEKMLCSIDQSRIDNFRRTELEIEAFKKCLTLLENIS